MKNKGRAHRSSIGIESLLDKDNTKRRKTSSPIPQEFPGQNEQRIHLLVLASSGPRKSRPRASSIGSWRVGDRTASKPDPEWPLHLIARD
jgi:hypothetical protein